MQRTVDHSTRKNNSSEDDNSSDSLLTWKALVASLSPPRIPPLGSAQRELLHGRDPAAGSSPSLRVETLLLDQDQSPFSVHQTTRRRRSSSSSSKDNTTKNEEAHSRESHNTLHDRLRDRLRNAHLPTNSSAVLLTSSARRTTTRRRPHPHLATSGTDISDQLTRFLGVLLPLSWQHHCRDSGLFRTLCDAIVTLAAPTMAVTSPRCLATYWDLSSQQKSIRYGSHPMQFVDVFLPKNSDSKRLVFFVHGGAWGSGQPWMYRLVATAFVAQGWSVAIPGYRTYPDGTAFDQVADCELAATQLTVEYPQLLQSVTVVGHSSGAHIALLMLVRRLECQQNGSSDSMPSSFIIHRFVGLSGPYDISHHFDYEAGRGLEELSPMKPSCGYTRDGFRWHSPMCRLQALLTIVDESSGRMDFPTILLLHGIEDATVPFTASAEAARVLRACGASQCHEIYLANTGHQDTVVQLMLGGRTQTAVLEWLRHQENNNNMISSSNSSQTQLLSLSRL